MPTAKTLAACSLGSEREAHGEKGRGRLRRGQAEEKGRTERARRKRNKP